MRKAFVLALLLVAGCGSQPAKPDFLARSVQDCADGDRAACAMLSSLGTASPAAAEAAKTEERPRTQTELDADAIAAGMRRARTSPPAQNMRIAPTDQRDS